ncbi:MAG: hypothetical protein GY849_08875 [Deltaproteobacteria bacterium]|nr:hypothetical protein [Deltaproteobacteria bacterium]
MPALSVVIFAMEKVLLMLQYEHANGTVPMFLMLHPNVAFPPLAGLTSSKAF